MLHLRLASGLPLSTLHEGGRAAAAGGIGAGLLQERAYADGRAVLTLRGRLLADAVVRDLLS
jgi:oxygen-independent coproporphyrinogen-3 oxidase